MGGIYVIVRHQGNIKRLLAGTEPKIGQKVQQSSEEPLNDFLQSE
jgi:glycerol-3-phosphate acyltransferase PlsY